MFSKVYIETTNICNLSCSFCPRTDREARVMTPEEYSYILECLAGKTKAVLFHLMGEPLLNPFLPRFIEEAWQKGFRTILTTNGTLLDECGEKIMGKGLYRVNISLHSFEANENKGFEKYLGSCFSFARMAAGEHTYVVFRLWNEGGLDTLNDHIMRKATDFFGNEGEKTEKGIRIADRIFIEFGKKFEWQREEKSIGAEEKIYCLGMRDQIGILCDGSVVPCCIDSSGSMSLGNIFTQPLEEILASNRAEAIKKGFSERKAVEDTCRKCGYRLIFNE